MTAAQRLPQRREWTVDDLAELVAIRVEHHGRTPVPIEDAVLAIEVLSDHSHWRDTVKPERERYVLASETTEVFTVSELWPITIDLPSLSARRAAILERTQKSREVGLPES